LQWLCGLSWSWHRHGTLVIDVLLKAVQTPLPPGTAPSKHRPDLRNCRPVVMVQHGATGGVNGPIACLSSRAYTHMGGAEHFRDPSLVALRGQLVVCTPTSDAYMGELGKRPNSSCAMGTPMPTADMQTALRWSSRAASTANEASAAQPSAREAAAAAVAYVDSVRQQPFVADFLPGILTKEETDSLAVIVQRLEDLAKSGTPVGVFLIEMFTAHSLEGYSYAYLLALRHLTFAAGVLLAIDDVMMGFRTGKLFSYMHYPGFWPDLITFGKAAQVSGVLRVSPRPATCRFTAGHTPVVHGLTAAGKFSTMAMGLVGGWLTNGGADRLATERALATVKQYRLQQLASRSAEVGRAVLLRLGDLARISGNPAVFARGIGLVIFTSARLNREAANTIHYARFIFAADFDPATLPEVLTAVRASGVNPEAHLVLRSPNLKLARCTDVEVASRRTETAKVVQEKTDARQVKLAWRRK
jgi:hypothetical protein